VAEVISAVGLLYPPGLTDAEPDSFDLSWRVLFGEEDVTELIKQPARLDHDIAERERDGVHRDAIARGTRAGLSQAVIGDVLGISQQRVGQLLRLPDRGRAGVRPSRDADHGGAGAKALNRGISRRYRCWLRGPA